MPVSGERCAFILDWLSAVASEDQGCFCPWSIGSRAFRPHLPCCIGALAHGSPYDHSSQTKIPRSMPIRGKAASQEFKSTWLFILENSTYLWPIFFSMSGWKFLDAFLVGPTRYSQHIHNHPQVLHTTSNCKAAHQSQGLFSDIVAGEKMNSVCGSAERKNRDILAWTEREFPAGYKVWTYSCDQLRWFQPVSPCWAFICGRRSSVFLSSHKCCQSFFHLPGSSCWRCRLRTSLVRAEQGESLYLLKDVFTRTNPGKG